MGLHGNDPACILGYEQLRDARLAENQVRMEALGLINLSHNLSNSARSKKTESPAKKWTRSPSPAVRALPARRSSRLAGTTLPSYKEVTTVNDGDVRIRAEDVRNRQPEVYTEEDEKLLGHSNEDWELFKDGYGRDGARIYDPINGKTCHQCRQKTLGLRTWCSQCESLRGQFCGDCLFMRYGENVMETLKNKNWVCPRCRGICNCSFCRLKKGWAPTGSMYRLALSLNFKSVAHYLIKTRRALEGTLKFEEGSTTPDTKNKMTSKAEGITAEDNETKQSEGVTQRFLTFETSSNTVQPKEELVFETSNTVQPKDEVVYEISDTERDDRHQRSDGNDTIKGRLRKRPRRCNTKSRI